MTPPGLVISAPASGTGKTTLMLGLLAAFRAQGLAVQPFKCGPDYIDPAFHAAASGRASLNLDSWAMRPSQLAALMQAADGADLVLAEGSMGLFDGVATVGETGTGASADIAALAGWPVVLVLDVSGQAQSAAATALGFATLRKDVALAGVVLNRVASPRHEALARAGMEAAGIRVLGALPRRASVALPERHLGLVQAEEQPRLVQILSEMADFVAAHVDLAALRAIAARTHAGESRSRHDFSAGQSGGAGARCSVLLHLSAFAGGVARGRRGDLAVFTLGRRSAGRFGRCLLAAGRLSGTACRKTGSFFADSVRGSRVLPRHGQCMASAVATWRWAKA